MKGCSAVDDHDAPLHQIHALDDGRSLCQRRCEVCGRIVACEDIEKAYDDGQHTVILIDKDLETPPAGRSEEIEVVQFIPSDQIEPMISERAHYLEPHSKSRKANILLRTAPPCVDRVAVVTFSLRRKARLSALRARCHAGPPVPAVGR